MSKEYKDGIYYEMPDSIYRKINAVNWSNLKYMECSPAHYKYNLENPKEQTTPMFIGTAVHCAILEPDKFKVSYGIENELKKRDAKWEAKEQELNKILLKPDEAAAILAMRKSVNVNKATSYHLSGGKAEVVIVWTDNDTGVRCKGKLDYVSDSTIVDVKTSDELLIKDNFKRILFNYDYHCQAAYYVDGLAAIENRSVDFGWVAVEKKAPYGSKLYIASSDPQILEAGRVKYKRLLKQYAECIKNDSWPNYPEEVYSIFPSEYDLRDLNN